MILNPKSLQDLNTGFRANFQQAFDNTKADHPQVATVIPSSTASNTYGWLGQFPALREWLGDRHIKNMVAHGYTINNKEWESTVSVRRSDIEDDQYGNYAPLFEEMARAAKTHPDTLVFDLLSKGFTEACYDGTPFFNAAHPVGDSGTASNMAATGSGAPWFLLDTSRSIKPLIFQDRKKPVLTTLTAETDESVFLRNEYRYGVHARCNVGFSFWQLAYASKEVLDQTAFDAAYNAMRSLKSDDGRPLNIKPTLLVVPPGLRSAAYEVVKAERLANGASNVNFEVVEILESGWL